MRPEEYPLTRLSVDLGKEAMAGFDITAAISPDGRRLVFPARGPDGRQHLATRLLDQAQSSLLPGTEGGASPFFSSDGQWIAFFSGALLKKIPAQGGLPMTVSGSICATSPSGSWGPDGNIVVSLGTLD